MPSAVIVEIMNDDGTMARRPELEAFAERHKLKIGTIADLIRYRLRQERSVERIAEQTVSTEFGEFKLLAYEDHVHRDVHLALVRGELDPARPPLVRVHPIDTLSDLVGVRGLGRTWTLREAMQRVAESGYGIVIVLRDHTSPRELADAVATLGERQEPAGVAAARRDAAAGPANLRHRRADPQGPRRHAHAGAVDAQTAPGHLGLRPRDRGLRGGVSPAILPRP